MNPFHSSDILVGWLVAIVLLYVSLSQEATVATEYGCMDSDSNWQTEQIANKQIETAICNRNCTNSAICDPESTLTQPEVDALSRSIASILTQAPCICDGTSGCGNRGGVVFSVAILPTVERARISLDDESAKLTLFMRHRTRNGSECNNNVAIVLFDQHNEIYISSSELIEAFVPSTCLESVISEATSLIHSEQHYEALKSIVEQYWRLIYDEYHNPGSRCGPFHEHSTENPIKPWQISLAGLGVMVILCILYYNFNRMKYWVNKRRSTDMHMHSSPVNVLSMKGCKTIGTNTDVETVTVVKPAVVDNVQPQPDVQQPVS